MNDDTCCLYGLPLSSELEEAKDSFKPIPKEEQKYFNDAKQITQLLEIIKDLNLENERLRTLLELVQKPGPTKPDYNTSSGLRYGIPFKRNK